MKTIKTGNLDDWLFRAVDLNLGPPEHEARLLSTLQRLHVSLLVPRRICDEEKRSEENLTILNAFVNHSSSEIRSTTWITDKPSLNN